MKQRFYFLFATAALLLCTHSPVLAKSGRVDFVDSPAEVQRKTAARERVAVAKKAATLKKASAHKSKKVLTKLNRAMLVLLGLEESKAVTSPAKRNRQLHAHQKLLKLHARQESRAHRARCQRQLK